MMLMSSLFILPGCSTSYPVTSDTYYSNPDWAPPYYTGVRYYYFPDEEMYYDLSMRQFVYFSNSQWFFSTGLPPYCSGYDLYNGFVIALNVNVYRPWLHHRYYLSHYPRYYYRNYYKGNEWAGMRGFNENVNKPLYTNNGTNNSWSDKIRNNPNTVPQKEKQPGWNVPPAKETAPSGNWKKIGQPVKVKPPMREDRRSNNWGERVNSNPNPGGSSNSNPGNKKEEKSWGKRISR